VGRLLRNRVYLGCNLLNASGFGSMFAYISGSPLVFMHGFGMSTAEFSLIFAITAAAIMVGSVVNGRAATKGIPAATMLRIGLALLVIPGIMLLFLSLAGLGRLPVLVPLIALTVFSQGLIMPDATHGALQPVGAIAGTASAGLRALQMLFGAVSSSLVAIAFDGHSARSMTMMMALCGVAAFVVASLILRLGSSTAEVGQAHG
jgi:DHA1 family bicyclomycin/chloramphenicol resistance-like MFS transporter